MPARRTAKKQLLRCLNCDGGLRLEDPSYGLTCPRCEIRVAGPFESAHNIPDYVPAPMSRSQKATKRRPRKSSRESREERLKDRLTALRGVMADAIGDAGWLEADPHEIEKWISVDDELTDRQWIDEAKSQLVDQSVLPEHAGAPSESVRRWNDVFISTYHMNIDQGMSEADAIDSARQNAYDTVRLKPSEHGQTKTDPKLYVARRWR